MGQELENLKEQRLGMFFVYRRQGSTHTESRPYESRLRQPVQARSMQGREKKNDP